MERRETFEAVADLYAEVRRGYPPALYDDLWRLAGLGPDARVLEVGCGAGQATIDLAARAGALTAVDPGAQLIAQARARLARSASDAHAQFVVSTFEAFDAEPAGFDLVASAQAWHWTDPAVAFPKAAAALRPGGSLAVFGHVPMPVPEPFASAFREVFDRYLPGAWGAPPPQAAYLPSGPFAGMIEGSRLFGPVTHRPYAWTWTLDPETFGRYLRTDSSYHLLPEGPRFALFDDLAAAVARLGGQISAPWETHLYLAAKA